MTKGRLLIWILFRPICINDFDCFGFVAAFIDSVVGGGGLIALPALLFTGLNPASAVATNKLASTMGSATSNIVFYRSGNLDLKSALKLFPITFIGSIIGHGPFI